MTIRRFILVTTLLGLFSSNVAVSIGSVRILLFYPLILSGLLLFGIIRSLWVPPGLLLLYAFLLISGAVGFVQGTDSVGLYLKSFFGISLSALYFCSFFRMMRFDVEQCFALYAKLAYYIAIVGLLIYPLQLMFGKDAGLHSVLAERGEFAIVCLPSLYYFADRWQRLGTGRRQTLVLLAAMILAGSSLGFLGILFGVLLFGWRYRYGRILMPAVAILAGLLIYTLSANFKLRINDTFAGAIAGSAQGSNLSTFALLSSAYVTGRSLSDYPVMGGGLGSHPLAHDRYVEGMPGIEVFIQADLADESRGEANSLLLRLLSETGIVGTLLAFGFILWCLPRHVSLERRQISLAILIYFFMKLLRSGIYFNPEEFFFIVIYAVNGSHVFHSATARARSLFAAPPSGLEAAK